MDEIYNRNDRMKKIICIMLCISAVLVFSSCKNGGGEVTTTAAATEPASVSRTVPSTEPDESEAENTSSVQTTADSTTEAPTEDKTTTAPSTRAAESIPITVNQALDRLSEFYGGAYEVNATVKENGIQYFKITDKQGNLYARVEVNLKTSDAKETIVHSGEVNEFNLSV